ncbi:MAG: dihydrofolate reductase [Bdellovibrionota bacterium]
MIISQIAAMASNRTIGIENKLPWNLPEDLKFFKQMTQKKIMIMGRKTFESLPGHLPGRFHIVISRSSIAAEESDVKFVTTLDEALNLAKKMIPPWNEEVMIIGGAEIYKLALPVTDRIYLTEIKKEFSGDTFFPDFSKEIFQLKEKRSVQGEIDYSFCTYSKI